MLVMNKRGGKPSRFFLRGMDFGTAPAAYVNGKKCAKAAFKDGVLSVALKFADHRDDKTPRETGEATITVTVRNSMMEESDPILVPVYVDDDADPT